LFYTLFLKEKRGAQEKPCADLMRYLGTIHRLFKSLNYFR